MFDDVSNEELRLEHIPPRDAPWHPTISEFALTFDGYEAMGNRLFKYAERWYERWRKDGSLPRDLLHLRSCLFMKQREVRWAEYTPAGPTDEDIAYAHALIDAIRILVAKRSGPDESLFAHASAAVRSERTEAPLVSVEEADFRIRDDGVTFHVRPTSAAGKAWLAKHVNQELTPEGGLAVKPATVEELILDIEADGLRFGPHEGEARIDFFPGESED
jgi:hypothetical protein